MQHGHERTWQRILFVLDALSIVVAMLVAFCLHGWLRKWMPALREFVPFEQYAVIAGLSLPLWLGLDVALGLQRTLERGFSRLGLARELAKLNLVGVLGMALLIYMTRSVVNRSAVLVFVGSAFTLMRTTRIVLLRWRRFQHRRGESEQRLLVVGESSAELEGWLVELQKLPYPPVVVGCLGDSAVGQGVQWLGRLDQIEAVFRRMGVDQVLFFPPYNQPEGVLGSLEICEAHGIPASFEISLAQPSLAAPKVITAYGRPFISFEVATKSPEALAAKHAMDFVAAVVMVLLLSPLLLGVSLAILVTSGRPVFFAQTRAGRNGRQFRMLKFRTMAMDAEAGKFELKIGSGQEDPTFKLQRDPRVTRLGRLLRRWSIDELPQLLNVISGSMSLVGPRPLPVDEHYSIQGWRRRRLAMKPGITGLWQVSGRSDVPYEEWMRLDVKYVDEWSLALDAALLLRTIPAVLSGRGAY